MKTILRLLMCVAVALTATSCLDDNNDNNGPTRQEMSAAMKVMAGTYTGYMLYAPNLYSTPDTVKNITWTIDSVITIKDFPQSILAKSFTSIVDSTLLADFKELPAADLKCMVGFYSISSEGYTMNIIPQALTFVASTSKQPYNCTVYFNNGDEYSMGVYQTSSSACVLMLNTYGLKMGDDFESSALFNRTYIKLTSTSKH